MSKIEDLHTRIFKKYQNSEIKRINVYLYIYKILYTIIIAKSK